MKKKLLLGIRPLHHTGKFDAGEFIRDQNQSECESGVWRTEIPITFMPETPNQSLHTYLIYGTEEEPTPLTEIPDIFSLYSKITDDA